MSSTTESGGNGYWYPGDPDRQPAKAVLEALRQYRAAEQQMRQRTRNELNINEKDLQALQYLMHAHRHGSALGPTELSRLLSISSASTTALIDRLVRSGHVERQIHPTDRRALKLVPTDKSHVDMHSSLSRLHERMMNAASSLSPGEANAVTRFLQELTGIVDQEPHAAMPSEPVAGPS
ncbi:MarR family transcriptional regulator [Arthrobacter sp. APC 3897]|uniref:MarR family winged helix-turn-helix transcriptional regulator n=1 Tax=Arthrobacter sp. APC 3897 TaxID=3035204 RepID=UPI0025B35D94|nr:MarR family transcriptional regulator [Arthrobacter sp. APC 3897]MDN3482166.1 MarR family transcriptional regulator [Arthrobacter sp. APC 3897]